MTLTIETLAEAAKDVVVGCCSPDDRTARELVTEILTAIEQAGYVVVPRELIREMWAAGGNAVVGYKQRHHDKVVEQIWSAMLSAAPKIQHSEGE